MKFLNLIGLKKKQNAPWQKYYQKKHMNIELSNESIYQYLKRHALNRIFWD